MTDFELPKLTVKDSKDNEYEIVSTLPSFTKKSAPLDIEAEIRTLDGNGELNQVIYAITEEYDGELGIQIDLDLISGNAEDIFGQVENEKILRDSISRLFADYAKHVPEFNFFRYQVSLRSDDRTYEELTRITLNFFNKFFPRINTDDVSLEIYEEELDLLDNLRVTNLILEVKN